MKCWASIAAIANITSARAAPSAPRRSGAMNRLAATPTMAAPAIVASSWRRGRAARGASRVRIGPALAKPGRERAVRDLGAGGTAQFGAQLLGHEMRVDAVADDLRPYEDDQLGAGQAIGPVGKDAAQRTRQLVEQRQAGAAALLPLADEAGQQNGLAAGNR